MNSESLVNSNNKDAQPTKAIDLKVMPAATKEAERPGCGNGVCEVSWKPFEKAASGTATKKTSA